MVLQQRQVQLALARKVLVQHGLADMGGFGDVVHSGSVEPVADKDFLRSAQQLAAAFLPGQTGGFAGLLAAHVYGPLNGTGPRRPDNGFQFTRG
ncbi:hypothetical protein GCM10017708_31820 [Arthrobacter citreus]